MQVTLWTGCAGAVLVAAISAWAERRRAKRASLDDVGFMPWPLVLIMAILAAALCAALAIQSR